MILAMRNKFSIALVFLVVFAAGGVTGWFLRPITRAPAGPPNMIDNPERGRKLWNSGAVGERAEAFLAEFTRELELRPDQVEALRPIVEAAMKQYIRFDREHLRLRKVAHDRAVEEIRALLDPAQQDKLDALDASSQKRFGTARKRVDGSE